MDPISLGVVGALAGIGGYLFKKERRSASMEPQRGPSDRERPDRGSRDSLIGNTSLGSGSYSNPNMLRSDHANIRNDNHPRNVFEPSPGSGRRSLRGGRILSRNEGPYGSGSNSVPLPTFGGGHSHERTSMGDIAMGTDSRGLENAAMTIDSGFESASESLMAPGGFESGSENKRDSMRDAKRPNATFTASSSSSSSRFERFSLGKERTLSDTNSTSLGNTSNSTSLGLGDSNTTINSTFSTAGGGGGSGVGNGSCGNGRLTNTSRLAGFRSNNNSRYMFNPSRSSRSVMMNSGFTAGLSSDSEFCMPGSSLRKRLRDDDCLTEESDWPGETPLKRSKTGELRRRGMQGCSAIPEDTPVSGRVLCDGSSSAGPSDKNRHSTAMSIDSLLSGNQPGESMNIENQNANNSQSSNGEPIQENPSSQISVFDCNPASSNSGQEKNDQQIGGLNQHSNGRFNQQQQIPGVIEEIEASDSDSITFGGPTSPMKTPQKALKRMGSGIGNGIMGVASSVGSGLAGAIGAIGNQVMNSSNSQNVHSNCQNRHNVHGNDSENGHENEHKNLNNSSEQNGGENKNSNATSSTLGPSTTTSTIIQGLPDSSVTCSIFGRAKVKRTSLTLRTRTIGSPRFGIDSDPEKESPLLPSIEESSSPSDMDQMIRDRSGGVSSISVSLRDSSSNFATSDSFRRDPPGQPSDKRLKEESDSQFGDCEPTGLSREKIIFRQNSGPQNSEGSTRVGQSSTSPQMSNFLSSSVESIPSSTGLVEGTFSSYTGNGSSRQTGSNSAPVGAPRNTKNGVSGSNSAASSFANSLKNYVSTKANTLTERLLGQTPRDKNRSENPANSSPSGGEFCNNNRNGDVSSSFQQNNSQPRIYPNNSSTCNSTDNRAGSFDPAPRRPQPSYAFAGHRSVPAPPSNISSRLVSKINYRSNSDFRHESSNSDHRSNSSSHHYQGSYGSSLLHSNGMRPTNPNLNSSFSIGRRSPQSDLASRVASRNAERINRLYGSSSGTGVSSSRSQIRRHGSFELITRRF